MPAKFSRIVVGTTQYDRLDAAVNGRATVVFNNPSGVGIRIAGESDSAPGVAIAVYTLISSNSAGVWSIQCNPSKTWVRADTGGATLEYNVNW